MAFQTLIFIGRSGCGKGTQADLLQEYIKKKNKDMDIVYVESGNKFREFLNTNTYSSSLSKEVYMKGGLQPAFLSIWVWTDFLIKNFDSNKHLILDGSPRKLNEAYVLDEALSFYKRENPNVIFINVSRKWAIKRLKGRNRIDDNDDGIEKRLDWFDIYVAPVINFYKKSPNYTFLEINGEQSIEQVYQEIIIRLKM